MVGRSRLSHFPGQAFVLALLLSVLTLAPYRAFAQTTHTARPLAPPLPIHFIVTATSTNDQGNRVVIDNPTLNANEYAYALFVTPNLDPDGACGCQYDPVLLNVMWYDSNNESWVIYTADGSSIPLGSAFNVLAVPYGNSVFMQQNSPSNVSGDSTYIDNPLTNGNPNALLLVSADSSVATPYPFGVWYNPILQKWAIFNENEAPMSFADSFDVMVGAGASGGGMEFVQTATASNVSGDSTFLDTSVTDANPNSMVFVTPNFNPGGACGCFYDPATLGVWYQGKTFLSPHMMKWAAFNEDTSNVPIGASFNILAFSS